MKGGNAEWFTPRRKRILFANGAAVGCVIGGIVGAALALALTGV